MSVNIKVIDIRFQIYSGIRILYALDRDIGHLVLDQLLTWVNGIRHMEITYASPVYYKVISVVINKNMGLGKLMEAVILDMTPLVRSIIWKKSKGSLEFFQFNADVLLTSKNDLRNWVEVLIWVNQTLIKTFSRKLIFENVSLEIKMKSIVATWTMLSSIESMGIGYLCREGIKKYTLLLNTISPERDVVALEPLLLVNLKSVKNAKLEKAILELFESALSPLWRYFSVTCFKRIIIIELNCPPHLENISEYEVLITWWAVIFKLVTSNTSTILGNDADKSLKHENGISFKGFLEFCEWKPLIMNLESDQIVGFSD